MQQTKLYLAVFVMTSVIMTVSAISCYQCNSRDDHGCSDLDTLPHIVAEYYKPCEGDFHGEVPFCRKTDITVMAGDLRRTIRSCGWIRKSTNALCYKADNDDHLETVCQCFEDGCNAATGLRSFSIIAVLLTTAVVAYFC